MTDLIRDPEAIAAFTAFAQGVGLDAAKLLNRLRVNEQARLDGLRHCALTPTGAKWQPATNRPIAPEMIFADEACEIGPEKSPEATETILGANTATFEDEVDPFAEFAGWSTEEEENE